MYDERWPRSNRYKRFFCQSSSLSWYTHVIIVILLELSLFRWIVSCTKPTMRLDTLNCKHSIRHTISKSNIRTSNSQQFRESRRRWRLASENGVLAIMIGLCTLLASAPLFVCIVVKLTHAAQRHILNTCKQSLGAGIINISQLT